MTISFERFTHATGSRPIRDDLERANCPQAGQPGHLYCGWCERHDKPRFLCGCECLPAIQVTLVKKNPAGRRE